MNNMCPGFQNMCSFSDFDSIMKHFQEAKIYANAKENTDIVITNIIENFDINCFNNPRFRFTLKWYTYKGYCSYMFMTGCLIPRKEESDEEKEKEMVLHNQTNKGQSLGFKN